MKYLFFLPEIHALQTGGNIYNRNLIRELKALEIVHFVIVNGQFYQNNITDMDGMNVPDSETVCLVDSLLFRDPVFCQWFDDLKTMAKKYVLVHYLAMLDPLKRGSSDFHRELKNLALFDGCIVTSQFSRKMLMKQGIDEHEIAVVRPGILPIKKKSTANHLPPRLISASSVLPGKGLLELLEILSGLKDIEWYWELAGETGLNPDFYDQFLQSLEKYHLNERIKISGSLPQDELYQKFAGSDIFVLPTHFESCSMVTMEAMAYALPVIAYRVGGLSELVEHNRSGFLVPFENKNSFARSLKTLILDPGLCRQFGQRGLEISQTFYDWKSTAGKLNQFIKQRI